MQFRTIYAVELEFVACPGRGLRYPSAIVRNSNAEIIAPLVVTDGIRAISDEIPAVDRVIL